MKTTLEGHFHMFCLEPMRFWPPPGRHGRSSENLQMLLNCKVLPSMLIALELNLLISHTVKVKMVEELSGKRDLLGTQSQKSLLTHDFCLNSQEIQSYLNLSKDIDALRDSQSLGECTSNSCFSQEREDLLFDPEMDEIIRNLV